MDLKRIETPGIAHYAWLLVDDGVAALVDPQRYVDAYLDAARAAGVRITHIVETHRHEDFVIGAAHLAALTGACIVNGDHELFGHGDRRLRDGDNFELGGLRIVALHTPGHTPESMSYAVYERDEERAWCVFTGDTLFFGDTGRTDLPDADASVDNARLIHDSVHGKIAPLGDTTLVLPAHGPGSVCGSSMAERPFSTIGEERCYNDVFTMEREAFAGGHVADAYSVWLGGVPVFGGWVARHDTPVCLVCDRDDDVDTAVEHLGRIGIDTLGGALAGGFGSWRNAGRALGTAGVITPEALSDRLDEFTVLDVREADEFDTGHIEDAVNVYVGHLEERIDELPFDRDRPVAVTCGVGHRAGLGVSVLRRHGFRDVRNLLGGMSAWRALGEPVVEETV